MNKRRNYCVIEILRFDFCTGLLLSHRKHSQTFAFQKTFFVVSDQLGRKMGSDLGLFIAISFKLRGLMTRIEINGGMLQNEKTKNEKK